MSEPLQDTTDATATPAPTPHWLDAHISRYREVTDITSVHRPTLRIALRCMSEGTYARPIAHLRHLRTTHGEDAYKAAKAALPGYTLAGTFAQRGIAHLLQHSGVVLGDLDDVDDVARVAALYANDPHVGFVFTSPGGTGLKVGVRVERVATPAAYTHAWRVVHAHYQQAYGVPWDESGKDIARLCFVSHDPRLYVQERPVPFAVPPAPPPPARPAARAPRLAGVAQDGDRPGDVLNTRLSWAELLEPAGWRLEREQGTQAYWTRPGKASGVSASTDGGGYALLYVFTSNAPPFEPGTSYTKFGAYTLLHHGGDYQHAAETLAGQFGLPVGAGAPSQRPYRLYHPWRGLR
jgi:hypothetical protein